jgi:Zinc finger, C3HC4 type (RING finger)
MDCGHGGFCGVCANKQWMLNGTCPFCNAKTRVAVEVEMRPVGHVVNVVPIKDAKGMM